MKNSPNIINGQGQSIATCKTYEEVQKALEILYPKLNKQSIFFAIQTSMAHLQTPQETFDCVQKRIESHLKKWNS